MQAKSLGDRRGDLCMLPDRIQEMTNPELDHLGGRRPTAVDKKRGGSIDPVRVVMNSIREEPGSQTPPLAFSV